MSITIITCDDKLFKLDDSKGIVWLLSDDDDGNPEWVEIKNRVEETK